RAAAAGQRGAGARAGRAGVAGGTRIAVVARGGVGSVHAPRLGPTGVVGAEVAVVAAERRAAHTLPAGAGVVRGAGVGIVAGGPVGGVHAPRLRPARVVRADVAVVTARRRAAHARAARADVDRRAGIAVVAGGRVRRVHAARRRVARVIGAHVVVVAAAPRPHALPARAGIARRAGVVIVAGPAPGRIHAARRRIAGVRRAHVGVVTRSRRPGTAAATAGVGHA